MLRRNPIFPSIMAIIAIAFIFFLATALISRAWDHFHPKDCAADTEKIEILQYQLEVERKINEAAASWRAIEDMADYFEVEQGREDVERERE